MNKIDKFEVVSKHFFCVFALQQSRKDVLLCYKTACTNVVAAQPQQKKRKNKFTLILL